MDRPLVFTALIITTVSSYAHGQESNTATLKLKEYARNVVSIISGDKAKTQIYCQIAI
jgi:hypothetical protein